MAHSRNIFTGDSYRAIFARSAYILLMKRTPFTNNDILKEAGIPLDAGISKSPHYGELKKAMMDLRGAIGKDKIRETGSNRDKSFLYIGKDDDPLRDMRNSEAIKDLGRYWEFCQDSAGILPVSWLEYFLRGSEDLLEIKKRKGRGEQVISSEQSEWHLRNIDMLPYLYESIRNRKVLRIRYKPYIEEALTLIFHPHYLREYNGRWFLLGHAEGKVPENGYNLALDRIDTVNDDAGEHVYIPAPDGFYKNYFSGIIGVTHIKGMAEETICVRAHNANTFYLTDTKPLHPSQKVSVPYGAHDDGEYGDFILRVELNNELVGRILQMGAGLEVIGPENVRSVFAKRIKGMYSLYDDTDETLH